MTILNIAAYLFVEISDPAALIPGLKASCEELALKGTILVAPEGINLFLAAPEAQIETFLSYLRQDPRFAALKEKRQYSQTQPFLRMKVKLKREIVPLGENSASPLTHTTARMSPETLKAWLDEGRDFILLDTRNRFEFEQGAFDRAVDLDIKTFRAFPDAVRAKLPEWRDRPIVTFCTGGIRCEKAAPVMQDMGFSNVYQLEGGILNYFEQFQSAHFHGDCFVFDERIGVDGQLQAKTELDS